MIYVGLQCVYTWLVMVDLLDILREVHSYPFYDYSPHGEARGILAIGNKAYGILAIGVQAHGVFAIGQLAFGIVFLCVHARCTSACMH